MGGRTKKFGARAPRAPKPKVPKARGTRNSRATKKQILFYNTKAKNAIDKARSKGESTISFNALTGKRVRAISNVKFTGGTGTEEIAASLPLSKISVPKSATTIQLSGRKSLDNVHKWHKGTAYDSENTRPFRVKILKNNQAVLHPNDAVRFAHYIATGGDTKSIRVTYTIPRATSKKMAELQVKFAEGKISKKKFEAFRNRYEGQMITREFVQSQRGNRTQTPQRYGGTLGNQTGQTLRSEGFSRSKSSGVYRAGATTSTTRKYKQGRKSTKSAASIAKEQNITIVPATEKGRVAQRRAKKKNNT